MTVPLRLYRAEAGLYYRLKDLGDLLRLESFYGAMSLRFRR